MLISIAETVMIQYLISRPEDESLVFDPEIESDDSENNVSFPYLDG